MEGQSPSSAQSPNLAALLGVTSSQTMHTTAAPSAVINNMHTHTGLQGAASAFAASAFAHIAHMTLSHAENLLNGIRWQAFASYFLCRQDLESMLF